jgi:hypothetical protein
MTQRIEVLDPTWSDDAVEFAPAPRLTGLAGLTVGVISNGKQGTVPFFDALERELIDRFGVGEVVRVTKPNYSAPAGDEIMHRARRWQALLAGVGD